MSIFSHHILIKFARNRHNYTRYTYNYRDLTIILLFEVMQFRYPWIPTWFNFLRPKIHQISSTRVQKMQA